MIDENTQRAFRSELLRLLLSWQAGPGDVLGALAEFDAKGMIAVRREEGEGGKA